MIVITIQSLIMLPKPLSKIQHSGSGQRWMESKYKLMHRWQRSHLALFELPNFNRVIKVLAEEQWKWLTKNKKQRNEKFSRGIDKKRQCHALLQARLTQWRQKQTVQGHQMETLSWDWSWTQLWWSLKWEVVFSPLLEWCMKPATWYYPLRLTGLKAPTN